MLSRIWVFLMASLYEEKILHVHRNKMPHETSCRTFSRWNANRLDTAFFTINTKKRNAG